MSEVTPEPARARPGRWRDRVALVLVVLAALVLAAGEVAWWVRESVYDTPTVAAKAATAAASPDTQAAVTALLLEKVVGPAIDQASSSLPAFLRQLSLAARTPTEDLVGDAISSAVSTESVPDITRRLVAEVNAQLVRGSGPIELSPDQLAAIAAPDLADNRVVSTVVDLADRSGCCQVVVAERDELPFVWQHVSTIRAAGVVLPPLAVGLGAAAVVVARRRLRAATFAFLGVAAAGAIVLLGLLAGSTWGVEGVGDPNDRSTALVRQAARTTFDVAVADLRRQSWALVVGGAVVALALLAVRVAFATRRTASAT